MAEKVELFEITIDTQQAVKDIVKSKETIAALNAEIKELKKNEQENAVAIAEKTAELKAEQKELRTNESLTVAATTANKANSGSLEEQKAQLAAVTIQYNKLSKEERENTETGKALAAEKLRLTNSLKGAEEATGNFTRNVGNYKESIKEAIAGSTGFNTGLLTLAANPVVLTITAIVATLKLLFDAFKSTQKGSDALNKAQMVLSATWEALQGILVKVTEYLIGLFENPKQALEDFATLIKDNIVNRFEGLLELIPQLGKAIGLLFEGKFSEAGKTAVDAVAKVGLGVEDFSDKVGNAIDAVVDTFNEMTAAIDKSVQAALRLQAAQIALEEANIRATTSLAKLNKQAELQSAIADDNTRSFKERQAAAEAARIASEEAAKVELNLAKQELNLVNLRNSQLEANGQLLRTNRQEQADAAAKVIDLEKQLLLTIQNNSKQRAEIDRDLFEKNLDYLLDNFDNVKSINERIAADDRKTFEERIGIIEATRQLGNQAFAEQIKELQTQTDAQINANELLAESDSRRLLEKVRLLELDEIGETRLLEVIRDRRTAVQDLADAEVEINQQKLDALQEAAIADQERKYELAQTNIFGELEVARQKLDLLYQQEIEFAEKIGADTTTIEEKYARAKQAIADAEFQAKLALAGDFLGNIATIAGQETAVGKAAAVAQTAISTYQGATSAYASLAPIPIVGPALGGVAAAAAVVAGLANVKKILAVKSGLPGDKSVSASGVSGSGASSAAASPVRSASLAPDVNQGIVSRDTSNVGGQNKIVLQPTLVTDNVTQDQQRTNANLKTATI